MPAHSKLEKDKEEIISRYLNGESGLVLAKDYDCDKTSIYRFLIKNGIELRDSTPPRIYTANEHLLDKLDTADKNYFLGFFYADGCNVQERAYITIGLKKSDEKILQQFNKLFESNRPLYYKDNSKLPFNAHDAAIFNLNSRYLSNKLAELGCLNRKSCKIIPPDFIEEKFMRDFLRGFFDGDGGITVPATKKYRITFSAPYDFCVFIKDAINKFLEIDDGKIIQDRNIYCLRYGKQKEVYSILNWFYKDSNLYLDRKYELYKAMCL